MPRYKKGDRWSARDANFVYGGVEKLLGFYDLPATGRQTVKIGKAGTGGITFDSTGTVDVWRKNPSTGTLEDTGEEIEVVLDWMHGDASISEGREVVATWFADEAVWRIMGAECELGIGTMKVGSTFIVR